MIDPIQGMQSEELPPSKPVCDDVRMEAMRNSLQDLADMCQTLLDAMDEIPDTAPESILTQMAMGTPYINGERVVEMLGVDPLMLQMAVKKARVALS